MTFIESARLNLTKKYFFDFKGRASRSEFWLFMLFILLVNLAEGLVAAILPPLLSGSLALAVSLLLLPPNLGVTVRRLHDRGMSGWWLLLPISALLCAGLTGGALLLGDLLSLSMCIAYLTILCLPGQPGPNRFGPPPIS